MQMRAWLGAFLHYMYVARLSVPERAWPTFSLFVLAGFAVLQSSVSAAATLLSLSLTCFGAALSPDTFDVRHLGSANPFSSNSTASRRQHNVYN